MYDVALDLHGKYDKVVFKVDHFFGTIYIWG